MFYEITDDGEVRLERHAGIGQRGGPDHRPKCGIHNEREGRHPGEPGGQRDQRTHAWHQASDEDGGIAMAAEPPLRPIDVLATERQPLAVTIDPRAKTPLPDSAPDPVPDGGADERPGGGCGDDEHQTHVALGGDVPGEGNHQFRRDRWKDVLEKRQSSHTDVAKPLDDSGDPVEHPPAAQRDARAPGILTITSASARPRESVVAVATSNPSRTSVNVDLACRLRAVNSISCSSGATFANSISAS